jgi:PAS domain S-box-containing protein
MIQTIKERLESQVQRMMFSPLGALMAVNHNAESARIFDEASEFMYFRDVDGRFTFVNQTFLRWLGLESADQVIGRTEAEVFASTAAAAYSSWHNDSQLLASGTMQQFEETISRENHRRTLLSIKVPVFNATGELRALFSMGIDISHQKLIEAAMQQVAVSITSVQGENVLRELTRYICEGLQVDFALIGRVQDGQVDVLAAHDVRGSVESFRYEMAGTPCESVLAGKPGIVIDGLQQSFPHAPLLRKFGFQSYGGLPLLDSAGQPIGILAVLHRSPLPDAELVSALLKIFSVRAAAELERLRADSALRASEEQYRAIFNASLDGLFLMNRNADVLDVNPAMAEMVGSTVADVLVTPVHSVVAPESQERLGHLLAAIGKGLAYEGEGILLHRDGHRVHVNVRSIPMVYRDVAQNLTIVRDISRDIAQQQQLVQSEQRLRAAIESSLDCIVASDGEGRIIEFNPMAEATFGIAAGQAIGRDMVELLVPERLRAAYRDSIAHFRRTGEGPFVGRRICVKALRTNGAEFDAELTAALADSADGKILIGFIHDITDQKSAQTQREQLQAQLRQAQKMEAIGHLAGGIAHDFNNLLTSLTGYVAMAQERLQTIGEQKASRFLEKSARSAERARNLVQQLLVFSRGQRGEPTALDLKKHLIEFEELLRATLPTSVDFHSDYQDVLPTVMVDPTQLDQVLMNLCINARDAMDGRGSLRVGLRGQSFRGAVCTSCQKEIHDDYVVLSVSDTGPGIEPAILERIFDPFFTTKPAGKGTGMGLSTTHGIVHDYGGHIIVDTEPGSGTAFRVLLPFEATRAAPDASLASGSAAAVIAAPGLRGSVLLVDDDAQVLEFMEEQLREWGLAVHAFADPRAALERVTAGEVAFDLAILDQTMPGISGIELARSLSELLPDPRIVLYTGYSEPICEDDLCKCCVSHVLHKPVDTARLHELLRELLPR